MHVFCQIHEGCDVEKLSRGKRDEGRKEFRQMAMDEIGIGGEAFEATKNLQIIIAK